MLLGAGAVLLVAVLAVVGGRSSTSNGATQKHVGKRLAIVTSDTSSGFFAQVACGAVEEGRHLGFKVDKPQGPPKYDVARQIAVTNAALARRPDALVFTPADPKASQPPVKNAVRRGLKLATVDSTLQDRSLVTSFIASDNFAGGAVAAKEVVRQIGGKGKVLAVGVVPDNPITSGRIKGFESVIKSSRGIRYTVRYPEVDITKIAADVKGWLQKNRDVKAIYTLNDFPLQGVIPALRESRLLGKVKIVNWDADVFGVKQLKAGYVTALIAQQPRFMARLAVDQLARSFDGRPYRKVMNPGFKVITKANANSLSKLFYTKSC